jgi:SHS2 domain-containing protein
MTKRRGFEYLEHTADVYVAAFGRSLEEAFENAALATTEVMTDSKKIEAKVREEVELESDDEKALLYDWIEELLYRFETGNKLFSRFKVHTIREHENGVRLEAEMSGELFNPERHPQKVGVKAITYHLMEIEKKRDKTTLKFILDV